MIEQLMDDCSKIARTLGYYGDLMVEWACDRSSKCRVWLGPYKSKEQKAATLKEALHSLKLSLVSDLKIKVDQERKKVNDCRNALENQHQRVQEMENILSKEDNNVSSSNS
jgi:hypothetical protein